MALFFRQHVPFVHYGTRRDGAGRWLFVKGRLEGRKLTLALMYAPNVGQDIFLCNALQSLSTFAEGDRVVMGDNNLVWDTTQDRTGGSSPTAGAF